MAGIDKTYVKTWEDYSQIKKWVESVGQIKDDFGNVFSPVEWLCEYTKEEFEEEITFQRERYKNYYSDPKHIQEDRVWRGENWEPKPEEIGEVVVWNTITYLDVWLIRNCPLSIIQERLKEQYAKSYTDIKERKSEFDTYERPAASSHFKITRVTSFPRIKTCNLWLNFQVCGMEWDYNSEEKKWYNVFECRAIDTNTASIKGSLTKKKLARLIKKWDLPAGIVLNVYSNYGHHFEITIKE